MALALAMLISGFALMSPIAAVDDRPLDQTKSSETLTQLIQRLSSEGMTELRYLTTNFSPRLFFTGEELAAAEYLKGKMKGLSGYSVTVQPFRAGYPDRQVSRLSLISPSARDLRSQVMEGSSTGDVTAPVVAVGNALESDMPDAGLSGKIALIERGSISLAEQASRVAGAGAAGAIIYDSEERTFKNAQPFSGTLIDGDYTEASIPVAGIWREEGRNILKTINEGTEVRVRLKVGLEKWASWNIIAEKAGTDSGAGAVVVGAHYDTVRNTQGASDNGTGVASLMVMANEISSLQLAHTVRFIFFGAEEAGLHGSEHYVRSLSASERSEIIAMLNLTSLSSGRPAVKTSRSTVLTDWVTGTYALQNCLDVTNWGPGYGFSDHHSFVTYLRVPAISFHGDDLSVSNTPRDVIDLVDSSIMGTQMAIALEMIKQAPSIVSMATPAPTSTFSSNVNQAPTATGDTAPSVDENDPNFSLTYSASDPGGVASTFTWSLSGTDRGDFNINGDTGELTFRSTPDYESPADSNRDNEYLVTVVATDGSTLRCTLAVTVTVNNVKEAPTVTGIQTPSFSENSVRSLATYRATDLEPDTIAWSVSGTDSDDFEISETGVLTFLNTPDFENPADANRYNDYLVTVEARDDGFNTAALDVTVTVTNECTSAAEPPCAPGGLRVSPKSGASLRATWSTPGTPAGTSITSYDLHYRESDSGGSWIPQSVAGTDRAHTIENLIKDTAYEVRVRAMNDSGEYGEWSQPGTGTPGSVPPPSPVTSGGGGGFGPAPVAPKFADGFRTTRTVAQNARPGSAVGDPVGANHQDDLEISYSLSGTDTALFTVDEETGQVRVKDGVDPELGRTYTVNLTATDSAGFGAIIIVIVEVAEATHHPYDVDRNGRIERNEVIAAIGDYFDGEISKDEIIELVKLYFAG